MLFSVFDNQVSYFDRKPGSFIHAISFHRKRFCRKNNPIRPLAGQGGGKRRHVLSRQCVPAALIVQPDASENYCEDISGQESCNNDKDIFGACTDHIERNKDCNWQGQNQGDGGQNQSQFCTLFAQVDL